MRLAVLTALLSLLVAACGTDGAPRYAAEPSSTPPPEATYGSCAFCHREIAANMIDTGGHGESDFRCESCHSEDLKPGDPGVGHRSVPACRDCHAEPATHPPAEAASDRQECAVCHTPHGSANLYLVREEITVPNGEVRDVVFTNEDGRADGSFASATNPGTGPCEICHDTTKFYRSDGRGESHFTITCTFCHEHENGFIIGGGTATPARTPTTATPTQTPVPATPTDTPSTPVTPADTPTVSPATPTPSGPTPTATHPFGICAACHPDKAESLIANGGHGNADFQCISCHDQDLKPGSPGPGHRNIPACKDCHAGQVTHAPAEAASDERECAVCHTPHGSPNLFLVRDEIRVPNGSVRDVVFNNEDGRADGSFASATNPGTGLCEICHDTTEFYRSDGTGEEHLTFTCTACHQHSRGFLPR